jgi:hypothetical protein
MYNNTPSGKCGLRHASDRTHGQTSYSAETMRSKLTVLDNERIKWVSGNLYECVSGDMKCRYRFSFGFKFFCSWLLNDKSEGRDQLPPCF